MENRGRRIALSGLAALLVLGACSGDDDSDDGTTVITDPVETSETTGSTSSTTTTIDPDAEVKAEVEEAYLAYWDAVLEIFASPNPEHPLIDRYTAEAVRDATLSGITQFVLDGQSVRPPDDPEHFAPAVLAIELSGQRAEVEACVVDGAQVVDNATETVINSDVKTKHIRAELVLESGQWKVAQSRLLNEREGVWTCES